MKASIPRRETGLTCPKDIGIVGRPIGKNLSGSFRLPAERSRRIGGSGTMHIGLFLGQLRRSERELSGAFAAVAEHHVGEADVRETCLGLASWSSAHAEALDPFLGRYGEGREPAPGRRREPLFRGPRRGGSLGFLRDLQDLWVLAQEVHVLWMVLQQAAAALRDKPLLSACDSLGSETGRQIAWIRGRIAGEAGQAVRAAA